MYAISTEKIHDIIDFVTWNTLKIACHSKSHCLSRVYLPNSNGYLKDPQSLHYIGSERPND